MPVMLVSSVFFGWLLHFLLLSSAGSAVDNGGTPDLKNVQYPIRTLISAFAREGYETDADGVAWFELQGQYYYHPVNMVRVTLYELDEYQKTGDRSHLEKARRHFGKLLDRADVIDGLPYLRYDFDWRVRTGYERIEHLSPPWYSGMAQGLGISAASRLYAFTQDTAYLETARLLLQTISLRENGPHALSHIDENGFYWIDVYETEPPALILNGHMFAMLGLYDLMLATGGTEGKREFEKALETVRYYAALFRVPGQTSLYSIKTGVQDEIYHRLHVLLLRSFHEITGDGYFGDLAEDFFADGY